MQFNFPLSRLASSELPRWLMFKELGEIGLQKKKTVTHTWSDGLSVRVLGFQEHLEDMISVFISLVSLQCNDLQYNS